MDSGPYWTDVVSAIALVAQLAILAIAAVFAWRQVGEAKQLREEQTRPFVVIDFDTEETLLFLQVSNIGATLARDVRFEIDPPLRSAAFADDLDDLKMLGEGISSLAPGKKIRTLFDTAIERTKSELPDVYAVTARYSDETRRRTFEESLDLDLGVYWNLMRVERREIHDIHERLKDMLREMKKWTSGTGRGLLRLSPEEARAENERTRRYLEERRAARTEPPQEKLDTDPAE